MNYLLDIILKKALPPVKAVVLYLFNCFEVILCSSLIEKVMVQKREQRICHLRERYDEVKIGDKVRLDPTLKMVFEELPKSEVNEIVLDNALVNF
jgi:hypothetical protein